eukprot:366491-Chlamydomonas_euryale.AAC.4
MTVIAVVTVTVAVTMIVSVTHCDRDRDYGAGLSRHADGQPSAIHHQCGYPVIRERHLASLNTVSVKDCEGVKTPSLLVLVAYRR